MARQKRYEELTFVDDFMFCKVLTARPNLCRRLLEIILQIQIERLEVVVSQNAIEETYDGRGIRLDVYVADGDGTVYDIEMQTTKKADIAKRMRYYPGMIDLNLIERGAEFRELNRSYIIFICTDDPFDRGLPLYTFENTCKESPDLKLGDEAAKVIVNAKGSRDGLDAEMAALLDFIRDNTAGSEFTESLREAVDIAVAHNEWRDEYMTLRMKLNEERAEGLAEGETRLGKLIAKLFAAGRSDDVKLAATDEEARKKFYREFGIID